MFLRTDFKNSFNLEEEDAQNKMEFFHKNEIKNDLKFMENNFKNSITDKIDQRKIDQFAF